MLDADIILPVTTANQITYELARQTILSCRQAGDGRILVMDNNGAFEWSEQLRADCRALTEVDYQYFPQRFSTSKFFNLGRDLTRGQYIAYGSSDLIFHSHWLENIIELWEEQPDWFCLAPFQLGSPGMSCAKGSPTLEKCIVPTHNVAVGVAVFRREHDYRWDEQFVWQADSDLVYHAMTNGLKMGYCCNSRVDHLLSRIKDNINHDQAIEQSGDEDAKLRRKWGGVYLG